MHFGGPIIAPCEPTVKIGGLPAARVTDRAQCLGATDSILKGSPTVKIGNQMAARLGDQTMHGGAIDPPCCVTVIIGDGGSGPQSSAMSDARKNASSLVSQCGCNGQ
jgi:uncharacterized Zn-binding protein involved in type VI secretion